MNYRIELDPRTDPNPLVFSARDNDEALAEIAITLGIVPPFTKTKLLDVGVRRVLCRGREISLEIFAEGIMAMDETQSKLLSIVETWRLSDKPEFRGFRCADCQAYFTGQAWHYWLHAGGYITPVHFCERCRASLETASPAHKPKIPADRRKFNPRFMRRTANALTKISEAWDLAAPPVLKAFTCDDCLEPLDIIESRPQGWHIWRNKDGILIEYHFDQVCGEKYLK